MNEIRSIDAEEEDGRESKEDSVLVPEGTERSLKLKDGTQLIGKLVKVTFTVYVPKEENGKLITGENMWVRVECCHGNTLHGILNNDPFHLPYMTHGQRVQFPLSAVIKIDEGKNQ